MKRNAVWILLGLFLVPALTRGADGLYEQADQKLRESAYLGTYYSPKLLAARQLVDRLLSTEAGRGSAQAWILKGAIYQGIARYRASHDAEESAAFASMENPASDAQDAIRRALELLEAENAPPLSQKEAARLAGFCDEFRNQADKAYDAQDYERALQSFRPLISIVLACRRAGYTETTGRTLTDQTFVVPLFPWFKSSIIRAYNAAGALGREEDAASYLDLAHQERAAPGIFVRLHQLAAQKGNAADARRYLTEGLAEFPKDTGLIDAEIGYVMQSDTAGAVAKIEEAIAIYPDNVEYQLWLLALCAELVASVSDGESAGRYFAKGRAASEKAVALGAEDFRSHLLSGALLHGVRNRLVESVNASPKPDGSQADPALQTRIAELAKESLRFFQRAESINPGFPQTLQMLTTLYRELGDEAHAAVFAERLQTVQAGGTVESSYFAEESSRSAR